MTADTHTPKRPSSRSVLAIAAGALAAATLIVFAAILPAEFNKDPLGLGRFTGLDRLWAPSEVAFKAGDSTVPFAREYPSGFRSDTIEIPLRAADDRTRGNELEYKVSMKKNATLIYAWSVDDVANPKEFYTDFHGQTLTGAEQETVATYKEAEATSGNGALTAPFDGIHGWYLQNRSAKAVVVRIKLAGFYTLIPPGDPGNDAGLIANVPADQAFETPGDEPSK